MRIKQDDNGNFIVTGINNRYKENNCDSTYQDTEDLFREEERQLQECCYELNNCIHNFDHFNTNEPRNTEIPFNECVLDGMNAINKVTSFLKRNGQIIDKLKKAFKKTLIQKKYKINDNEISNNSNKLFGKDEKWWKRIKVCGSHLFSTKATIKGKINKLFNEFVKDDKLDKDYESKFDKLFNQLTQHNNARKEIKSCKEAGNHLNKAFDNSHKQLI